MSSANRRLSRRGLLETLGLASSALLAGCSSSPVSASSTSNAASAAPSGATAVAASACVVTPEETAGPYPDRTGMINQPAFFRQDITEGGTGTPLMLTLTVVNVAKACAALPNASVEIWQCDASGNYSEYAQPGYNGVGQTFLRGLQTTDAAGRATFRTIYPGWYQGRATHIHNASDNVFADGTQYEMATLSGDPSSGYAAALTVGVNA